MSKNCDMIKDLLPLYADDVCSEESRKAVEEHIKNCPECKAELEKLCKNVTVSPQKDADVLKRIKKRLRIENAVVGLIVFLTVLGTAFSVIMFLANTLADIDYDRAKLESHIALETDDNKNLWLYYSGISVDRVFVSVADKNGKVFGEASFDKENKNSYGVTFKQRRINIFTSPLIYKRNPEGRELLFNLNEHPEYDNVFYFDRGDNEKHIIWERDKND
ncbi:zf-HC2 domain-containing protein [Ruminococcus sp.]|uniref:zf-HC2 domain-containing protein n=1 Tax=Ruminococcus sp. TaxID=41978 RepID=UPI0025FAC867|nr:zf-HC2 domain-containing protein [Ruminococcus sp.]MCR4639552.1 zf-HC2 domain-containing protein [Ruminococcus sp.]